MFEPKKRYNSSCYITKVKDGGIFVEGDYDPDFIDALKRHIPAEHRAWDNEQKRWWVSEKYARQAVINAKEHYEQVFEV